MRLFSQFPTDQENNNRLFFFFSLPFHLYLIFATSYWGSFTVASSRLKVNRVPPPTAPTIPEHHGAGEGGREVLQRVGQGGEEALDTRLPPVRSSVYGFVQRDFYGHGAAVPQYQTHVPAATYWRD